MLVVYQRNVKVLPQTLLIFSKKFFKVFLLCMLFTNIFMFFYIFLIIFNKNMKKSLPSIAVTTKSSKYPLT